MNKTMQHSLSNGAALNASKLKHNGLGPTAHPEMEPAVTDTTSPKSIRISAAPLITATPGSAEAPAGLAAHHGPHARQRINAEERHQLIEKAAYFRAAHRGFESQGALNNWLEAQAEIDLVYEGDHYSGE